MYGAVSGMASKVLVYPLDTGKKLLQVYEMHPASSVGAFLQNHFRTTGVRGLYAGVVAAMLKSGLSSSLLFGLYALSKAYHFSVSNKHSIAAAHTCCHIPAHFLH